MIRALASATPLVAIQRYIRRFDEVVKDIRDARFNKRRFLAATESSHDSFFILESVRDGLGEITDFRFVFVNAHGARLLSTTPEEIVGRLLCVEFPFNRPEGFFDKYKLVVQTGQSILGEYSVLHEQINAKWLLFKIVKLDDGVAITTTNITERKTAQLQAASASAFTDSVISSSPFTMIVTGLDGIVTSANTAAERMLEWSKREIVGKDTCLVFREDDDIARHAPGAEAKAGSEQGLKTGRSISRLLDMAIQGQTAETDCYCIRKDGSPLLVHLTITGHTAADGVISDLICIAYDITERKRTEDQIFHLAHHDALTGLPTRLMLNDRLEAAVDRAARNQEMVALLTLDLDNFKRINDALGHHVGDALLVAAAHRLLGAMRECDTVARKGGDEFVVLVENVQGGEEAEEIASRLLGVLAEPVRIEDNNLTISASIGVCLFPDGGDTGSLMLKNADAAMYHAKGRGRNRYQFFTPDMASATARKRSIEGALRTALAMDEFELVYQPQISLPTGLITGMEVLLRWRSRKLGLVMPNDFIPIAEETGMIVAIGAWVLRTACYQAREFTSRTGRKLVTAVNVSPRQFENDDLPKTIAEALATTGLDPSALEIEITENILINDSPKAAAVLDQVRALGVRIAIDDFGTGFSSMSYILRFNVDRLKIDQSFVRNLIEDPNSRAVTAAMIDMAHRLKITVIAEGVETAAHRDFLTSEGCDDAQGYYYSRPVPMEGLENVMYSIDQSGEMVKG